MGKKFRYPPLLRCSQKIQYTILMKFIYQLKKRQIKGQALFEFLIIMAMTFVLAMGMLRITNRNLGKMWKEMVEVIAAPSKVQIR
jgi:hypothetical protein